MLTRKQHDLLILIHERLQEDGVPPSFEEMKVALDLKSKSGIHRLITALEERGFIRRLPNRARALEVIRLPEGYVPGASVHASPPAAGFTPSVIEGGAMGSNAMENSDGRPAGMQADNVARFPGTAAPATRRGGLAARYGQGEESSSRSNRHSPAESGSAMEVPVMGRIAAGVPIAAIQDPSGMVAVPPSMLGMGKHYALEIQGDSMIGAGILDGDTVIIQETGTAELGDIVVALVDGEEATLKRFRKLDGKIALEAANPAYETRILEPGRVKVQGRLAGLVRRY